MKARLLGATLTALLILTACGDDDGDDSNADATTEEDDTPAVSEPASTASDVGAAAIGGLEVTAVDLDAATAVLTNTGDEPVDLTGHWLCNRPSYAELPAVVLAAGEALDIGVAGATEAGGEVAIYSSDDFGSSDDIITYVHWGAGGGRAPVAEEAGIWSGPPVEPADAAIELVGEPGSADGWS